MKQLKLFALTVGCSIALAVAYNLIGPNVHAFADHGSDIISTGSFYSNGAMAGDAIPSSVNSAASFKAYIYNLMQGRGAYGRPGSYYNRVGASFIIETMLHGANNYAANDDLIRAAQRDYATWANYVDQYSAAGRINWSYGRTMPTGSLNSRHLCRLGPYGYCWDEAVYYNNNYNSGGYDAHQFQFYRMDRSEYSNLIIFYNADGTTFQIRRECANVIGEASPLRDLNKLPIGHYDSLTCTGMTGWMFDPNTPSTSIHLYVYVNGTRRGPGTANVYRPDVNRAYRISGNHGFSYNPNGWSQFNPRTSNTISVNAIDWETGQQVSLGSKTVGPCVAASCGTSTFPQAMVVGQQQSFNVTVNLSYPWGPPYTTNPWNPALYVTVRGPDGVVPTSPRSPVPYNAGYPTAGRTLSSDGYGNPETPQSITFTPNVPGDYYVQWQLGGYVTTPTCGYTGGSIPGPNSGQAGYEPYFSVLGGDIAAGPGFGTNCTDGGSSAGIKGWNRDGVGGSYYGAGSWLGALALGPITSFSSQTNQLTGNGPNQPNGLTFANSSGSPPTYGGSFNKPNWCVPDYYGKTKADSTNSLDFSSRGSRTYDVPGGLTLGNITVGQGADVTLRVSGNVYIDGNVTYSAYNSLTDIPRLQVLVQGGNIYVDHAVTDLHGLYVAEGDGGSSGVFYTCAKNHVPVHDYDTCNTIRQPLTIYGAVSASRLSLDRAYGSIYAAPAAPGTPATPAQPAEQFVYTPALWLADLKGPNQGLLPYQAATGLPPIL